ncbi:MAG: Ldh family oxidoreductase [Actinobacteria bacterium]|nr:Ldh family oxidoreductase [Actinomycetota bacterium]
MVSAFVPAAAEHVVAAAAMRAFATNVMHAAGCTRDDATLVADVLVEADLRGVFSHGVTRLTPYVGEIAGGTVDPGAEVRTVRVGPSIAIFDARKSPGPRSAKLGMEKAIELAQQGGTAFACVRDGTHFGPAAHWALLAAGAGCIGIATSNGGGRSGVLAYGSRKPALTNGPIAWAIPAKRHAPIVADMAVGVWAFGKVRVSAAAGQQLPDGVGVDADGQPTRDPNALVYLHPFAGPKGAGLGIVIETLCGILARAVPAASRGPGDPMPVGQVFAAINIAAFRPPDEFLDEVERTIDAIHALRPAEGFERVLLPGEPEWLSRERALREGIRYPKGVLGPVALTAQRLGVTPVWPAAR